MLNPNMFGWGLWSSLLTFSSMVMPILYMHRGKLAPITTFWHAQTSHYFIHTQKPALISNTLEYKHLFKIRLL